MATTLLSVQSNIQTLGEVLNAMAPFAGGSIPGENDAEYANWVGWINQKQEEYSKRAFWRRCLTREEITIEGITTILPVRFDRPNGIWMLIVDGQDWMDPENEDEQFPMVEMINDPEDANYGKWQIRFTTTVEDNTPAILWYFSTPAKVVATTDRLLLPGDMIAYSALMEYYRTTGAEGSEDKAEEMAENRFTEYLSIEVLPSKNEILNHSQYTKHVDYLQRAKNYYRTRTGRNTQL